MILPEKRNARNTFQPMVTVKKRHGENYYLRLREKIYDRLSQLPRGTVKERLISGHTYYYLQRREGKKVLHTYIGKEIPAEIKEQFEERVRLRRELDEIRDILRGFLVKRIKGPG